MSLEPPPTQVPEAPTIAPPRGARSAPIVAAALVVALLIAGAGGSYVYGNGKVNSAIGTYNQVARDQSKLGGFFKQLSSQFSQTTVGAGSIDSVKQDRSQFQQMVSQSKSFQPTVASDDEAMVESTANLHENSWLTMLSKTSIDKQLNNITHARASLAIARTILADYIQYGTFYESVDSAVIDVVDLSNTLGNQDVQGAIVANRSLQTDVATAITLENAPGVAHEWSSVLTDMQSISKDISDLISAAQAGNTSGIESALNAYETDSNKLDTYDFAAMNNEEGTFYKKLIDSYQV